MRAIFKEIGRTRTKLILQIGTIRLRTHRSGWTVPTNGKRPMIGVFLAYDIVGYTRQMVDTDR